MFIQEVNSKIISDSRREKTIQVELKTYEGKFISSAPSGKSRGENEVDPYNERGIEISLKMFQFFCKKIIHKNFIVKKVDDLKELVEEVKRFETEYGRLGGNVTYALETVFLKAGAAENNKQLWELINDDANKGLKPRLPMPIGNCIGGGLHSKLVKGKRPDFQEFLLIPREKTFSRAVTLNIRAYDQAKRLLKTSKRNDEGAWRTNKTNEEVLDILRKVATQYNLEIGIDVAASTFYEKGYYNYKNKELIRDKVDQADYMERLAKKFNIFYVEDPMQEEDFGGFKEVLNAISKNKMKTLIVGDDLTTTNIKYLRRALESKAINAIIIKPNQIGSMIEVKRVVEFCKKNNLQMIFSHRSGETMDDAIADYCVGFGGHFIKTGIFGRERLIKLKRVMDIEKNLLGRK
ncbi:MAG: hypothetical protein NUV97_03070 [archaeon]|nr:hypothetical protein [archaeon]MCR4324052.1 hypothetical protein [Nanoarchaeota archaeon]